MWTYRQSTGQLAHDGEAVAQGYSGHGIGKNNPTYERIKDQGPIPQGWYTIGPPEDTQTHGPHVLRLTPEPQTLMYGRAGFLIHGESKFSPGAASKGCIILARTFRDRIAASGDNQLTVIP